VGGEQDGLAELAQVADDVPAAPRLDVEPGGGLVEEYQVGIAGQGQREVEPPSGRRAPGEAPRVNRIDGA
jgi:hypothetical protein